MVEDPLLDRSSGAGSSGEYGSVMRICSAHCLIDAFRWMNPVLKEFTFLSRSAKTSSRIDRALVSASLMPLLSDASHCRPLKGLSDHWFGVKVTFKINLQLCMGPGIWRCKAAEIGRPGAAKVVAAVREEHRKSGSGEFSWLMRKMNMALRKYSTEERKRVKATLNHLDNAVAVLQQEVMRNPYCYTRKEELRVKESQLAAYLASEQERVSLMAGVKELREGEMPGKLMPAKVKTRKERTMITSLQWKGMVRRDSSGILEAASEFYAELFSEPAPTADSTFWPVAPDKRLGEAQTQLLLADWSEAEVKEALDGMAKGKSPGAVGIPKEFFSQHWDSLGGDVLGFAKQFEKSAVLPPAALEAVTVLLHKKGTKDQVQNYRPITLLNSTYKLVARVLANRMRKVLNTVISEEQYGFLPGRRLADGVSLIADIVEAAKCKDEDWYLLLVDFQKAFDLVSREYLFGTMERMSFPRKFVQWCEARRRKLGISNSYGDRLVYVGYADDTTLVLKGKRQIGRAVKLLSEFGDKSGLRVNNDKSALMPLGRNLRKKPDKKSVFKWVLLNEAERVLGVWVSPSGDASVAWEITLVRASSELVKWQILYLTTSGRVAVVNGYINPILAFQAQVYPPPAEVWAKLVKLLHNFVTGNHSTAGKHFALWSQELLFKARGEGGLGVRDPCAELGGLAARRIALLASQPLGLRADLALAALDVPDLQSSFPSCINASSVWDVENELLLFNRRLLLNGKTPAGRQKAARGLKRSVMRDLIKVAGDGSRVLKDTQELEREFGGTAGAKLAKWIFDAAPDEWKQLLLAPVTAHTVLAVSKFVLKTGTSYGVWRIECVDGEALVCRAISCVRGVLGDAEEKLRSFQPHEPVVRALLKALRMMNPHRKIESLGDMVFKKEGTASGFPEATITAIAFHRIWVERAQGAVLGHCQCNIGASLSGLERLELVLGEGAEEFLSVLTRLPSLRTLKLNKARCLQNLLKSDGSCLKELRQLNIDIACDELTELPAAITTLHHLTSLKIHAPKLSSLPDAIGSLSRLRRLNISNCSSLTHLPDSSTQLSCLHELNASNTSIRLLPPGFTQLSRLMELDLSNCKQLEAVPDDISSLKMLEHFSIDGFAHPLPSRTPPVLHSSRPALLPSCPPPVLPSSRPALLLSSHTPPVPHYSYRPTLLPSRTHSRSVLTPVAHSPVAHSPSPLHSHPALTLIPHSLPVALTLIPLSLPRRAHSNPALAPSRSL
ncbi:unnamed protein product [Closterium sp. Yama58-4]|nr:unnamed protein product [Closterium sp. Yama58-4]